jgi:D-alanine-D-alanine ligase
MKKLTLALLSGGDTPERAVSQKGGDEVFEALDKQRYDIRRYDPKYDLGRLVADADGIDAALLILHGPNGEDGTIQGLLDLLKIPYQGSGVLGSSVAMNKLMSKHLYERAGIPIPEYTALHRRRNVDAGAVIEKMGLPLVVKPAVGGSSIGVHIVGSEADFSASLAAAFALNDLVLVEKYIQGVEITCGVIGSENPEPLPLIEILPGKGSTFFDYEAKYTPGATQEICPARISEELTREAQAYGIRAHEALFCRGYSRTDMIYDGKGLYVFETNTIPGMTSTSLLPLAAKTAGISFSQLLDRLIDLSLTP